MQKREWVGIVLLLVSLVLIFGTLAIGTEGGKAVGQRASAESHEGKAGKASEEYEEGKGKAHGGWGKDDDEGKGDKIPGKFRVSSGIQPVKNAQYAKDCASCHFQYLPGLLPAASWRKLMAGLDNHFGQNAELDAASNAALTDWLVKYSADNGREWRSRQIMASLKGQEPPVSVTDIPFIKHKHSEIPARMIAKNPKVRTLANCIACHSGAEKGDFNEDGVNIPGFGRWED